MRPLALLLGLSLLLNVTPASSFGASAAATPPVTPSKRNKSQWVFSLLPKAFQKNPQLDLTVITEMTDAGKKLPPVSSAQPAYVELFAAGYHSLGEQIGNEKPFPEKEITELMEKSLRSSGYLPAKRPEHPPSLLIIYTWGTHNLLKEADPDNPSLSGTAVVRNLLDRAALVGGAKFAAELRKRFDQADSMALASGVSLASNGDNAGSAVAGGTSDLLNPINLFRRENEKNEVLLDQATNDVYYVVASAYDYASATAAKRTLLWRTRMTVAAAGISQDQSVPTLVLTAGPYFGKDMPDPEVLTKRAIPDGNVEVGTPIVVPPAEAKADVPSAAK